MPNVTQLLGTGPMLPTPSQSVVTGVISNNQPAPTSFADPLYVLVPERSIDSPYVVSRWPAIHGATLPAQGAEVLLAFDQNETPIVVWWDGVQTDPAPPTPTWTTPTTFRTNYIDYGTSDANFRVGYWLAPNGTMWCRGAVSRVTSTWTVGDILFVLPRGPSQTMDVASAAVGSNAAGLAFLQVQANGNVVFLSAPGLTWGAGANVLALDNIRFPVAP